MNIQKNSFVRKYPTLLACIFYVAVALIFTFPLIFKLNSELPKGGGDVYQSIANISSGIKQVQSLGLKNEIIYFAKNLNTYAPYVWLGLIINKIVAYNIIFLSSFILSAIGMYLLAFHLTKNRLASLLAGLIFAFSPFHYYQSVAVHLGSMHQEWIPFLVLYLIRFFEKFEFKYFAACGVFALLIAMAEHQLLAFMVLFVLVFVVYKFWLDRSIIKNRKFWAYVAASGALLGVIAFGMFGKMLKVATSDNNFLDPGMNAANRYSMGALDPIAPPTFHALWPGLGELMQKILMSTTRGRGSYFVGFSVMAVLVYFVITQIRSRKNKSGSLQKNREVYFWGWIVAVFYIFSLGPSFSIGKYTLYLPYYLVYKFLPFYENIRTTGRMFVFALLGISVLFAYGFAEIIKRYQAKKILLAGVFAAVILLEFWVAPVATMAVTYSPFYDQIAKDTQKYKLIEIPGSTSYEFASYDSFLNTIANKSVLNGMPLARKISKQFAMQQSTPVVKQLLYTIPKGNDPETKDSDDIIVPFDWSQSNDVLNYYHVRWVTISKRYVSEDVLRMSQQFIEKHIAYASRYEDDFLVAYEVAEKKPAGFYVQLNDSENNQFSGDYSAEDGLKYREMGDGASLKIVNMGKSSQKVKITVFAKGQTGLKIASGIDSQANGVLALGAAPGQYSFDATLAPGDNIIPFSVKDENGSAVSVSTSKKKHSAAIVSQISVVAQ